MRTAGWVSSDWARAEIFPACARWSDRRFELNRALSSGANASVLEGGGATSSSSECKPWSSSASTVSGSGGASRSTVSPSRAADSRPGFGVFDDEPKIRRNIRASTRTARAHL